MSQTRRGWVVTEGGSQGVRIFPEGEYPRGVKPLFFYDPENPKNPKKGVELLGRKKLFLQKTEVLEHFTLFY